MTAPESLTCLSWATKTTCQVLEIVGAGLNSNFSTALLGSLAGAFGGAIAAQRIAERSKHREEILTEIRHVNSAVMVAATICNTVISSKTQHVNPLWAGFQQDAERLRVFEQEWNSGQEASKASFHYTADLRIFPCPTLPIAVLEDFVFNRLKVFGRPLSIVSTLAQSIVELKEAYAKREEIILEFRSRSSSTEDFVKQYFGFPNASKETNRDHPDIIYAMSVYTDDCIFFSSLLCDDLTAHGRRLRALYEKKFGKGAPEISHADFTGGRASGTVPPSSKYADWLKGFPEYRPLPVAQDSW
jgi:hypothetical protein